MSFARRNLTTILVAMVTAAVTAGGPAFADGVRHALFAHDADKVDGKHAVGAGTTTTGRAGKLVATNTAGRLPDNIIAKAPDANLLDGKDSRVFASASHLHDARYLQNSAHTKVSHDALDIDADTLDGVHSDGFTRGGGTSYFYAETHPAGFTGFIEYNDHFGLYYGCPPAPATTNGELFFGHLDHGLTMLWMDSGAGNPSFRTTEARSLAALETVAAGDAIDLDFTYGTAVGSLRVVTRHTSTGCNVTMTGIVK